MSVRPDRRDLLLGAAATVGTLLAATRLDAATPAESPATLEPPPASAPDAVTDQYKAALARIVGAAEPKEERVTVDIPAEVENGNIVPYKLSVESEMSERDRILRLHLLSTQNPQAAVATFQFTAHSGRAAVTGRMRLAKTQAVVAVAETNDGTFLIGRSMVSVAIGGCGSE